MGERLVVALFATRHIGNHGTLVALSVGGIGKCRYMSKVLEVDVTDESAVFVVDPYSLH